MKKLTTEEFIKRAIEVHDDKYDYSKVEYKNNTTKVKIICPIDNHGDFYQRPSHHFRGTGCPSCSNNKKSSTKEFINKSKLIHGNKFDYSLVKYINTHHKIIIICPIHGKFPQEPNTH